MKKILFILLVLLSSASFSQQLEAGNLIPEYGKTFKIASPGFKTDTSAVFKVVFDVDRRFQASEPNALIETAARFLNMHEKAGVDPKNMQVALVIHGKAVWDVLKNEYYQEKNHEVRQNPNLDLIEALSEEGVEIIICGQSATHYNVTREKASENVKFALSAMTALVQLQNNGYQLIKF
ncbi:DsrE family protein [Christiangramia sp.]|uniref:DsrE family protein n=1 Tax=Christiangramia sp. TaxID=1931228 RepID=UPI0026386815|nr:DsrE family protein [Christiangramia sp.]